jgi:protein CpxP
MTQAQQPSQDAVPSALGRKGLALGALVAATSAAIVLSLNAWGAERPMPGEMPGRGGMAGCEMHQGHQGMGGMGSMAFDGHHLDKMLDDTHATDAQRSQIRLIADKARADLTAMRESATKPGAGQQTMLNVLTQPKIDAAAAEKARQAMVAQHDAASKRMLQASLDIAKVLTPEQRAQLAERMQKRGFEHGQEGMHGEHGRHGGDH